MFLQRIFITEFHLLKIQTELKLTFEKEEWEKHGFKTREAWIKACEFDREFKYMKRLQDKREDK